jgi:hypothetical protein
MFLFENITPLEIPVDPDVKQIIANSSGAPCGRVTIDGLEALDTLETIETLEALEALEALEGLDTLDSIETKFSREMIFSTCGIG